MCLHLRFCLCLTKTSRFVIFLVLGSVAIFLFVFVVMKQSWFIFGAWQVELALAQKLLLSPEELPHSPHLCQNPRSHVSYFVCHLYYFLSSLPKPKIKLSFQNHASYFVCIFSSRFYQSPGSYCLFKSLLHISLLFF